MWQLVGVMTVSKKKSFLFSLSSRLTSEQWKFSFVSKWNGYNMTLFSRNTTVLYTWQGRASLPTYFWRFYREMYVFITELLRFYHISHCKKGLRHSLRLRMMKLINHLNFRLQAKGNIKVLHFELSISPHSPFERKSNEVFECLFCYRFSSVGNVPNCSWIFSA